MDKAMWRIAVLFCLFSFARAGKKTNTNIGLIANNNFNNVSFMPDTNQETLTHYCKIADASMAAANVIARPLCDFPPCEVRRGKQSPV